ncbi:MAG: OprD family porin [Tenuifilaceae bacterium]|jgi:hypothetical protein|nr:OprD family porin [Tenuifilaceae bacterium]
MNTNKKYSALALSIGLAAISSATFAEEQNGFFEDASVTLQARNYYFMRDFSDIVGPSQQSKSEEWAQGFILNAKSGYTPGVVGFGIDAIGMLGIKLDSGGGRVNTGLLPSGASGKVPDSFSRVGAAVKMRISKTELKIGELTPNPPVLTFSDIRLLPPTYQGASILSQEIKGLTLQAGQFRSGSLLNRSGHSNMSAKLGHVPQLSIATDRFNYVGADYRFNQDKTSAGVWYAQLDNIYKQQFYNIKHYEPVGAWVLGANVGIYDSKEDGSQRLGNIDNTAYFSLLSAKYQGSTLYVGYQSMHGDDAFPRVFNNVSPLGNEVPTYEFAGREERSWQLRHDYDFAFLGAPGLASTVRYIRGNNVKTGMGYEGREWERDLDLAYTFQSGVLKDLNVKLRNVVARSNYRTDIDENRLIFSYTWKLL